MSDYTLAVTLSNMNLWFVKSDPMSLPVEFDERDQQADDGDDGGDDESEPIAVLHIPLGQNRVRQLSLFFALLIGRYEIVELGFQTILAVIVEIVVELSKQHTHTGHFYPQILNILAGNLINFPAFDLHQRLILLSRVGHSPPLHSYSPNPGSRLLEFAGYYSSTRISDTSWRMDFISAF